MSDKKTYHMLDFKECLSAVKFLDKCMACAKQGKKCKYRIMLGQILLGKAEMHYEIRREDKMSWADVLTHCPHCSTQLHGESYCLRCGKCGFSLDY